MFDRFKNIVKAKLNQQISKMETPEMMAEQAEMQLESDLGKIMEAVAEGLTNEKLLQEKIKKNKEEIAVWEQRAKVAVQQQNDEIAKQCLAKKSECSQNEKNLEAQVTEQRNSNQALKAKHAELQTKLKELRMKKGKAISGLQASDAMAKAGELLSGPGGLSDWEEKINQKEAKGQAFAEIADPDGTEAKLKAKEAESRLDDELSSLKAQIKGIKIIEDKDTSAKEVVDKNLPMVPEPKKPDEKPEEKGK